MDVHWPLRNVLHPLSRWATGSAARVVMYHRFSAAPSRRRVSAADFEAQIRYIRKHFEPCALRTLAAKVRSGEPLDRNLVAITVDDGYADFLDIAYPILQRYGVPATIYVVTRFANQTEWLWFDALRYYVSRAKPGRRQLTIAGVQHELVLDGPDAREAAWHQLGDACLALSPRAREGAFAAIEGALDIGLPSRAPVEEFRAISWQQLRSLDPELIDVGSHTASHPILSHCSDGELESELSGSKAEIERQLNRVVSSFSFPNGQPSDYNERVIEFVERAGYENAVVAHGSLVLRGADPFTLQRIEAPAMRTEFLHCVNGARHLLQKVRRTTQSYGMWAQVWR